MSSPDATPRFEEVDWDDVDGSGSLFSPERATLLVGTLLLAVAYWYDTAVAHVFLVGTWKVERIDWALLLALVVLGSYGVVPALRNRGTVRRVLGRMAARPVTLFGAVYLIAILAVGALEPFVYPYPGLQFQQAFHPPVGFATDIQVQECLGTVTGGPFDRTCHGSMALPLGANERGFPMEYLIVTGARVTLYVLAITGAFVVPLAAVVGIVAGLRGGLVDDALMAYVDLQLCLPAIVVYVVANTYWNTSLFVLLATFGLLSWGGIARLVRSETLQRREAGHVRVARGFGASGSYIARRHILPNVTNTLLPAAFQLLALLVLVEAGIAFLGFNDVELYSWGSTMAQSLSAGYPTYEVWWVSVFPGLALVLTVFSLKLVGDGLRDALDPRGGR
jgi:peptide/nickel transport system permease protein